MKNRIQQLFQSKTENIFSLYFCAGHPSPDSIVPTIEYLSRQGVDLIEIGIPFSDPLADGPVIQDAARKSLRQGMTLRKLFEALRQVRQRVNTPLVLMGYLNPILRYGFENFCQDCQSCGIDGMIIPDLPICGADDPHLRLAQQYQLTLIRLITPTSSEDRIRMIDQQSDGFLYMVSSNATTGTKNSFTEENEAYFKRIKDMKLKNPCLIGFGISNRDTLTTARKYAAGTIIGSKFVALLDQYGSAEQAFPQLLESLK